MKPDAATQTLVIAALWSTSFDGLSRTRFWVDLTRNLDTMQTTLLGTVGLVGRVDGDAGLRGHHAGHRAAPEPAP